MLYVRVGFFIAGVGLAIWQAVNGHFLIALAATLTAFIALAGVLFGWERRSADVLVQLAGAACFLLSLSGMFRGSPGADIPLQHAYAEATRYLLFLQQGVCPAVQPALLERASLACSLKESQDMLQLGTDASKVLHGPPPAWSILEGLSEARKERPRNTCALDFAEVHRLCGRVFLDPKHVERLLKEAGAASPP